MSTCSEILARKLLKRLQGGFYSSDKLPSQRDLAKEFGVSRTSVMQAMQSLRASGWIRTSERKRACISELNTSFANKLGKFLGASNFAPPPANSAFIRQDSRFWKSSDVINLSVLCDEHWDEHIQYEIEEQLIKAALEKYRMGKTAIYQATGITRLKELICRRFASKGIAVTPSEVAIVPRRLMSYRQISDLFLGGGSELWIPELSLSNFYGIGERLTAKRKFLPMNSNGEIDFGPLYLSNKPRIAFLEPDRQKPTGASICEQSRQKLVKEAQRSNILLFEDCYCSELYEDRLPPLLAHDPDKKAVIHLGAIPTWLTALSCFSYVVANERIIELFRASVRRDYLNPEFLSQLCAIELLETGLLDEMLARFHHFHRNRLSNVEHALTAKFAHCAQWSLPGSFGCIWLKLPEIDIARIHRGRKDVDFEPGWLYGKTEDAKHHVLLRYSLPWEQFQEGLQRFWTLCQSYGK